MMHAGELTPSERTALVGWWLAKTQWVTNDEAAERLGLTPKGAHSLLERLSRVLPIYYVGDGIWHVTQK